MAREAIQDVLLSLRTYALSKDIKAQLYLHHEESHFMRLANSAVSLNTHESLTRLDVTVFGDKCKASSGIMTGLNNLETMKACIDRASEMLVYAAPLSYQPSLPNLVQTDVWDQGFDSTLSEMPGDEILSFVREATLGLESDDILLSGNFSCGATHSCTLSTATSHLSYWAATDAQITLVLSSLKDKWEINAEQSATCKSELCAKALHDQLSFLQNHYLNGERTEVPLGDYRVVFGPAATAEYLGFLQGLGLSGLSLMQGYSINRDEDVGQKKLSTLFTLTEDPSLSGTFPMPTDQYGITRKAVDYYDKGVFKGFMWDRETADQFGRQATGNDVMHDSLILQPGDSPICDARQLSAYARENGDLLYVPYLHYTGLVNPSEGLVTGTTRFGALLFKQDGRVLVPYNVRFTEKLGDLFGDKLLWLSKETCAYNTSNTYDRRNPMATIVPKLICCDKVSVELSNKSF